MTTEFTPLMSLIGGAMIGLSAVFLLASTGKIAGISGTIASMLPPVGSSVVVSVAFIVGLLAAAPVYQLVSGTVPEQLISSNFTVLAVAGLLVGVGTILGNGCTSGHGVCGISRLSPRSIVATGTFMATGLATVFIVRHVL